MNPPESPRRLGRGLDALLSRVETPKEREANAARAELESASAEETGKGEKNANRAPEDTPKSALRSIAIADIKPNPFQPRQEFRPEELADLQSSLAANGLLQPVTVRPSPTGHGYELIAGERRLRASTNLGWTEIAAIVRDVDDKTLLTLAMVENLQRSDLDPMEEADGYHRLMDEFLLSQQEVADIVGKNRSTVANAIRLRQLPAAVRRMLQERHVSAGHARALLALTSEREIIDLARTIVADGLSVRDVERLVKADKAPAKKTTSTDSGKGRSGQGNRGTPESRRIEELLRRKLQTAVKLQMAGADKGSVNIEFYSHDDLERLLEMLGVSLDD